MHTHDGYVVGTVLAGAEQLQARGGKHLVSPGDVLRLHPDEPHANCTVGSGTLSYLVFYLPHASIVPYLDDGGGGSSGKTLSFPSPVFKAPRLASALIGIHRSLSRGPPEKLTQECGMLALVQALTGAEHTNGRPAGNCNSTVRRARLWIDEHFAENFGLLDVASVVKLSVFRLAHLFKEGTGLSPIAYRNQRRVNEARRLLLCGEPIAETALQVGFTDQSHLTRHFQRIVGLSPHRYRQQ